MDVERFKNDHVTILVAVSELRELVQGGVAENAGAIAKAIVSMSSKIKLHLAAEDRSLYPRLVESKDATIAETARRLQGEMGPIATVYTAFAGRWNTAASLTGDPDGFRGEANQVFGALHQRIQRENRELYPLLEMV